MNKIILFYLILSSLNIFSQTFEYDRYFQNSNFLTMNNVDLKVGDTLPDNYFDKQKSFNSHVKGFQYPNLLLNVLNNDTCYLYNINSDLTILNFNYYYCDDCVSKIDYYIEYKNKSKKTVSIISVFSDSKNDVYTLVDKYKNENVFFIADFNPKNKNYYLLNNGTPTTFILDRNKNIIELLSFDNQQISN